MTRTDAILERLLKLHPEKMIDLSLTRIIRLLEDMGRPQDRLPPVIHVAGTNGKGSTIAHLRAFLEASGQKVHVYTSPHLVRFNERIRLAGTLVDDKRLNAALEHCERVNDGKPITYFEITTAAAIWLFAENPADILLLEVGLGGRFDATNVIDHPLGTIITPVSVDHVEFLGDEVSQIAREKAGILKRGAPAVIARQPDEAREAISARAQELGIEPAYAGEDFDGYAQDGRLIYQDDEGLLDLPPSRLNGPFQNDNATLAIAALRHFGLEVDADAIARGLRDVDWPARLMPIKRGVLHDLLPSTHELWLDGGHNEAGGGVLANALRDMQTRAPKPLVLILGAYANKDAAGYMRHFVGLADKVLTVRIVGERASWTARELSDMARSEGLEAKPMRSVRAALLAAADIDNARVVICGGLYLAGRVLAENKTLPE